MVTIKEATAVNEENHNEVLNEDLVHPVESPVMNIEKAQFQPKLAGFWVRFWAYMIDLIVLASLGGLMIKPIFRIIDLPITNPPFILFSSYKLTMLIIALLYFLLMTKFFQQTIGKMVLGIKVVTKKEEVLSWDLLIFREVIGRFISKTLVLPYVLVAFMPQKEALHDIFAGTYVVHESIYEKKVDFEYLKNNKVEQLQEQANI